jgi:para-nitrobenzyl esterase
LLVLLLSSSPCVAPAATDVQTTSGMLRGTEAGGLRAFKGVPYAAPPVAELRWRAPQPVEPWEGVRPATQPGAVCMQPSPPERLPMSEDCLFLNVWTLGADDGARPVMVWIHGGSFLGGSGSAAVSDGAALARHGVVVVTLNYRLGRFGFFAHPALAATRPPGEAAANFGLMDQMAALYWVRRNVRAFGGDPDNITLFGESSGAAAVLRLMISPAAKGLFHRAVVQSGNGRDLMPRLEAVNPDGLPSARAAGRAFALGLGLEEADAAALRAIPAADIVAAGSRTAIEGGPVLDGRLLPADVGETFARGGQARVPLMVGFTALELPVPADRFESVWERALAFGPAQRAAIESAYDSVAQFRKHALSDVIFAEPARFLAAAHAAHGEPAYLYRFAVLARAARQWFDGTPHARELPYVFGNLQTLSWPTAAGDEIRADEVMGYWTMFARSGDPNGSGREPWPRYRRADDVLLDFSNDGPVAAPVPNGPGMDAIAELYPGQRPPGQPPAGSAGAAF